MTEYERRWIERLRFKLTGRWSPAVVAQRLRLSDKLEAWAESARPDLPSLTTEEATTLQAQHNKILRQMMDWQARGQAQDTVNDQPEANPK